MSMSLEQSIPCPDCGTAIHFDTNALLAGAKFACPNCEAEIALTRAGDPSIETVRGQLSALKAAMENSGGEH